jgi:hypothetical protein
MVVGDDALVTITAELAWHPVACTEWPGNTTRPVATTTADNNKRERMAHPLQTIDFSQSQGSVRRHRFVKQQHKFNYRPG